MIGPILQVANWVPVAHRGYISEMAKEGVEPRSACGVRAYCHYPILLSNITVRFMLDTLTMIWQEQKKKTKGIHRTAQMPGKLIDARTMEHCCQARASPPPPGRTQGQPELEARASQCNVTLPVFYFSDGPGRRETASLKELAHSGMEIHFRRPPPTSARLAGVRGRIFS